MMTWILIWASVAFAFGFVLGAVSVVSLAIHAIRRGLR